MLFINKLTNQIKKLICKQNITNIQSKIKNTTLNIVKSIRSFNYKKIWQSVLHTAKYWMPATSAIIVIGFITATSFLTLALKVEVDDKLVGYVTDEFEYSSTISKIEEQVTSETGEQFKFEKTPVFSYTVVSKTKVENEQVYNNILEQAKSNLEDGFIFTIDDVEVGYIKNQQEVLELLDTMLVSTKAPDEEANVRYTNKFKFTKGLYSSDKHVTIDDVKNNLYIISDATVYTVLEFDTASSIANKNSLTITNLSDYNKNVDLTNIVAGQQLKLTNAQFKLDIIKEKLVKEQAQVPFETTETVSRDLIVGSSKLISSGENGISEITAKVIYENGKEVSKEIIETTVIKAPVNAQVVIGKKETSYSKTTLTLANTGNIIANSIGKYSWPVPGSYQISSPYGSRWGSFHPAIDIPANTGTATIATDSGTIIAAGPVSGGLGISIEIKHDNGTISRYGHLSSVKVSVGQRVTKGQVIGAVGSTGNSTGSHLHFELIINGTTTNPDPLLTR